MKKTARLSGVLYLIVVVSGIFHLMYVPSRLFDWKDPAATVSNVIASETLFRLGILSGLICYTTFLFLPFAFYKLLSGVNKTYAVLMVTMVVVSVAISFVNMHNYFAVLTLLSDANFLGGYDTAYLQGQVLLYLHFYSNGNEISSIFWGLWLLPLGYLVFKSGFLPRVLGILLMAGCFGYILDFLGGLLFSKYAESGISDFLTIPGSIGEIGICFWLLIKGVKTQSAPTEFSTVMSEHS